MKTNLKPEKRITKQTFFLANRSIFSKEFQDAPFSLKY